MDRIRWVIEIMKGEQRTLSLRPDRPLKSRADITYAIIFLGIGVGVVLLSLLVYLFMGEIADHTRFESQLRKTSKGLCHEPAALPTTSCFLRHDSLWRGFFTCYRSVTGASSRQENHDFNRLCKADMIL